MGHKLVSLGEKRGANLPDLDVWTGQTTIRIRVSDASLLSTIEKHMAPARVALASQKPEGEVHVSSESVRVVSGPTVALDQQLSPLVQLEILLIEWTLAFAARSIALHAGCVIYRGTPVVFVTESGGGKSSLTLAAVQAGATYITDDLLLVEGSTLSGLARAIRFKQISPLTQARPDYLDQMDCESYVWEKEGEQFVTPIWTGLCPSLHEFDASNTPCVVVRVSRGPDKLSRLSEVERLVTLHEAAILRCGEYDGSLGPGPTYHLSWEDPAKAFGLLAQELDSRK